MGFEVPIRKAIIEFEEGHDYFGAEIEITLDHPAAFVMDIGRKQQKWEDDKSGFDAFEKMCEIFTKHVLIWWNITKEGVPVPTTAEGLMSEPPAFVRTLMDRWIEEATSAPAPLGEPSSNGQQSPEESIAPAG